MQSRCRRCQQAGQTSLPCATLCGTAATRSSHTARPPRGPPGAATCTCPIADHQHEIPSTLSIQVPENFRTNWATGKLDIVSPEDLRHRNCTALDAWGSYLRRTHSCFSVLRDTGSRLGSGGVCFDLLGAGAATAPQSGFAPVCSTAVPEARKRFCFHFPRYFHTWKVGSAP